MKWKSLYLKTGIFIYQEIDKIYTLTLPLTRRILESKGMRTIFQK